MLTKKEWVEVINNNLEAIQSECEEAYAISVRNPHMNLRVSINKLGEPTTHHESCSGGHFTENELTGEDLFIGCFCSQDKSIEIASDDIRIKLDENGIEYDKDMTDVEVYDFIKDNYSSLYDECNEEAIDYHISCFAYDAANALIDECVENLNREI